ncbi:MAG: hypothetical protein VW405_21955, partial [Rhodospirillaceae bacterium]
AVAQSRGMATAIIAFADPLRQAAAAAYGINAAEFTDDALKDRVVEAWGITRRQMLINLGEAMRGVDPDHWVKAWRRAVAKVQPTWWGADDDGPVTKQLSTVIITPDLRRVNEANAIHAMGGLNVLLRRDGVTWDGHINEALAQVAQHRDDALAAQIGAQIGAWYRTGDAMSIADATTSRRIFDCDAHNPVSARQCLPVDDAQRSELTALAAAILDRAVRS